MPNPITTRPAAPPLRLDLVIRTSKRKKEGRSPQQQKDMASACANMNNYAIGRVHDSNSDESGKTMDRATLRAVMERVRTGECDGVIVALLDRLGRAPVEDAMRWVRELHAIGGVLVPADAGGRPLDLSDPAAETNLVLQLQIARQYWLSTANRFKRSVDDAIAAGRFVGPAPLGYRAHKTPGPDKGKLYKSDDAPAIRDAFLVAGRDGLHAAIDHLKAAFPSRRWTTDDARKLLAVKAYMGWSYMAGYDTNKKAHDPIVTERQWTAAQTTPRGRRSAGDYPLSFFIHCGRCRSPLVGGLQTARGGRTYRRMRCADCAGSSIRADKLEDFLMDHMRGELARAAFRDRFAPNGLDDAKAAADAATEAVEDHNNMPADLRRAMGSKRWQQSMAILLADEREARDAYDALEAKADMNTLLPLASELDDPAQFRRALVAVTTVTRIVVGPGRVPMDERIIFEDVQGDDVTGALGA